MTTADDIAALKARVAELERANKPPSRTPEPWQRFDPTANMSMPQSTMLEMADVVPTDMMREIVRDNQAPKGPSSQGAIPSSQHISNVRGTGWAREIPISNPPGTPYVDALCIADDVRQRAKK